MANIAYQSEYYGVVGLGDSLYHHGIKGQKWGIRRYQNPDGSLTAEGKARYATGNTSRIVGTDAVKHLQKAGLLGSQDFKKQPQRAKEAADLGLRALERLGYFKFNELSRNADDNRDWFLYEDQMIGYATVADQINRGRTAKELKRMINDASSLDSKNEDSYGSGINMLRFVGREMDSKYGGNNFIDACYNEKKSQDYLKEYDRFAKNVSDDEYEHYLKRGIKNAKKDVPLSERKQYAADLREEYRRYKSDPNNKMGRSSTTGFVYALDAWRADQKRKKR